MPNKLTVTLHADSVAGETSGGSSTAVDIGATRNALELTLQTTGTVGYWDVVVESDNPADSNVAWIAAHTFRRLTGSKIFRVLVFGVQQSVRVTWSLNEAVGSDVLHFGLSGDAHTLYSSKEDLDNSNLVKSGVEALGLRRVNELILSANDEADGYLSSAYDMPLVSWGRELVRHTNNLAVYEILSERGFDPEGPDATIMQRHEDSVGWFKMVARNQIRPASIVDTSPGEVEASAFIVSRAPRGW